MTHPNLDLIDAFFAAYSKHDYEALRQVLADHATWTFPGHQPLSGTKIGIDEIVALFDAIGSVMGSANANVEKLVIGMNEQYIAECQHIRTNRAEGPNLDQQMCVLWSFENGKIAAGKHMTADQDAFDAFFMAPLPSD
jgi:uncharacterized protein